MSGRAIVTIESRAVPIWRKTLEPTSRIQPEMFMICSTKGMAVATMAVVMVPASQAASAIQVTEPTRSALSRKRSDQLQVKIAISRRKTPTWPVTEAAT